MRNKLPVAQCNEVLVKVLLHEVACVVHAIENSRALAGASVTGARLLIAYRATRGCERPAT